MSFAGSSVELDGSADMRDGRLIRHIMLRTEKAHLSIGRGSAQAQVIIRDNDGNIVEPTPAPTSAQRRFAASRASDFLD